MNMFLLAEKMDVTEAKKELQQEIKELKVYLIELSEYVAEMKEELLNQRCNCGDKLLTTTKKLDKKNNK